MNNHTVFDQFEYLKDIDRKKLYSIWNTHKDHSKNEFEVFLYNINKETEYALTTSEMDKIFNG